MLVMSVLVLSTSLGLLFTHSAAALPLGADDLLKKTVQPIVQLLPVGNSSPPQANSEPVQSNNSAGNAAPQSAAAGQASSPSAAASTTSLATSEEAAIQPLDPLAPIDMSDVRRPLKSLIYLANAHTGSSDAMFAREETGGAVTLPIQASEEGWRLLGIAWYWWLVAASTVYYSVRYLWPVKRIASSPSQ